MEITNGRPVLCYLRFLWFTLLICVSSTYATAASKPENFEAYNELIIKYRFSIPDSGIYYCRKALAFCRSKGDLKGEAMILNHWGIIDENQGRFDLGRQKYLQAIKTYRQIGFSEGVGDETIRLGVTEMRRANFNKAIGYFLEALRIHERIGSKRGVMECYDVLGEAYMGQSNWVTALEYLKKGDDLSRQLPLSGITLYIYNNLGVTYTNLGDLNMAMEFLRKGVGLSDEPQYAGLHITLLNSMAMVYTKSGKQNEAIALQLKALDQARKIKNYLRELQTLNGLADSFAEKDPERALKYLQAALTLALRKNAGKVRMETLSRMARIYERKHQYLQALQATREQHKLKDSIFDLAKVTEIANLQANYQLQRSQNNVERLRHLNKEQTNRQLITIGIAISVSLITLILAYYFVRARSFNKQLSVLNKELQDSNQVKDKMFSIIGHDLRAPIATLKNFLFLLDNDALDEDEKSKIIQELIKNTDASMGVLDQLLNWGQMQIKGVMIAPTDFAPAKVIDMNILLFSNLITEKKITVNNRVSPGKKLHADPNHFDIVMRNLISNSLKFTPDGGTVAISSELRSDGLVYFSITDNGIGLKPEVAQHIFDRNTISSYGTRGEKGTGLGLLLCKEYVEANGGTINVQSEPSKGTTFVFSMRAATV